MYICPSSNSLFSGPLGLPSPQLWLILRLAFLSHRPGGRTSMGRARRTKRNFVSHQWQFWREFDGREEIIRNERYIVVQEIKVIRSDIYEYSKRIKRREVIFFFHPLLLIPKIFDKVFKSWRISIISLYKISNTWSQKMIKIRKNYNKQKTLRIKNRGRSKR